MTAHYNSGLPTLIWENPTNFNSGGTGHSHPFIPPAGATEMQIGFQVTMDKGRLAFSEPSLSQLRPEYTITRKTYALGGQTIATRISGDQEGESDGLYYIHSDHLGSTSVMSYGQGHSQQGEEVLGSEAHYLPFGDWRVEPGHELTDQGFTGQKHNMDLGLYYYNARFYLPGIGRFASPDTIVPDPTNPQQYNRYTYTLNNPLRFTDPTGHCAEEDDKCWEYLEFYFCHGLGCSGPDGWQQWIIAGGDSIWTIAELAAVRQGLLATRSALVSTFERINMENWIDVLGGDLTFRKNTEIRVGRYVGRTDDNEIWLNDFFSRSSYFDLTSEQNAFRIVLHEIGHAIDFINGDLRDSLPTGSAIYYRDYGRDSRGEGYADGFAAWVWHDARTRQGMTLPSDHVLNVNRGDYVPHGINWDLMYHTVVMSLWQP